MSLKRKKMAAEVSNASAQTSFRASRQATLVAGALILLAILAAYCNTFSVPFTLDDQPSIVDNNTIRHLWPIQRALSPPGGATTVSGRPVLNLSLALNYAFSGTKVWSYHALNLAIHILASLTLFGIVRRTLLAPLWKNRFENSALPLALAVALLWSLHPLQTEAVTYVIQRAESLMGLFNLLTLYCFIRAAPLISNFKFQISNTAGHRPISNLKFQISNTAGHRPISNLKFQISNLWFVLCIAACLLGMGTKEVMVSAPLMVLLYDRTFVAGSFARALRQRWGLYAGLAATWLVLVAEFGAQNTNLNATLSPWTYAQTQCWAIVHYLRLAAWPRPLTFDYGQILITEPGEAAPWALIIVALAAGTIVSLRRWPALGFLGFWFFAILAPTSSVMPLAGQTVAEHRMYLPLAGVLTLMVACVYGLGTEGIAGLRSGLGNSRMAPPKLRPTGLLFSAVLAVAALALLMATRGRNEDYRDDERLWRDTVAKRPNNARAHDSLGIALARKQEFARAIAEYQKALSLQPDYAQAHYNFGNALLRSGRPREAIGEYQAALAKEPDDANTLNNYGNALYHAGRAEEGILQYRKALAVKPDNVAVLEDLAGVLVERGKPEEARQYYETALRIASDDASAHNGLGGVLFQQGRLEDAMSHWSKAVQLQPGLMEAHNNLASALVMKGRAREAVAEFNEALRLDPDNAAIQNNLAWLLAASADGSVRDGARAAELAQRANQLAGGKDPVVLGTLAAALAEQGSFAEALATGQRALELATAQSNSVVARNLRGQIELYKARRPCRDAGAPRGSASTNATTGRKN